MVEDESRVRGGEMNNNPSPGNKAGAHHHPGEIAGRGRQGGTLALTTLRARSAVTAKGFAGGILPATTGAATGRYGGANMICFTTGRGSAYGCKPSPSLKLATNSAMFERQEEDMDINCGVIVDGSQHRRGRPAVLRDDRQDRFGSL
jgi:altronate hydrolase